MSLEREVRHLASLLGEAGRTLGRIANHLAETTAVDAELDAGEPTAASRALEEAVSSAAVALDAVPIAKVQQAPAPELPEPVAPSSLAPTTAQTTATVMAKHEVQWPWEEIISAARAVLAEKPARRWRPGELCRAVRDHGVELPTLQGMHWGLLARLRQLELIDEKNGTIRLRSEAPEEPWPWEKIMQAARALLAADPERRWRQAELGRAVRDAGVKLPRRQGMHFGMVARLRAERLIDEETGLIKLRADPAAEVAPLEPQLPEPRLALESDARIISPAAVSVLNPVLEGPRRTETAAPAAVRVVAQEAGAMAHSPAAGASVPPPLPAAQPAAPHTEDADTPLSAEDAIAELREEVTSAEPYLDTLEQDRRTAQLAIWAGRARAIQERLDAPAPDSTAGMALYRLFGVLTRIGRELRCGWVDALSRKWTTHWPTYIEWHQAALSGHPPQLLESEVADHWRDVLLRLNNPDHSTTQFTATAVLLDALEYLGPDDEALIAASRGFGDPIGVLRNRPAVHRVKLQRPGAPAPERVPVDAAVLARTRGKRALLLGGQGAREPQREALQQAFEFQELDWETSERGQAGHYDSIGERVRAGSYDLLLFLSAFSSHKATSVVDAAKSRGVPVVYLSRGYGLNTVVEALKEQLRAGRDSEAPN